MIVSDKVITVYKNGKGIYEVLAELEKGARELSKYTLEEQMELIKAQIMQQTATAALSQANTAPQIVLQLFQS